MTTEQPVAMISGASRGIGAAIAAALRQAGWGLSLGVRRPAALQAHPDDLVCRFEALEPGSEAGWVEATRQRYGRIDALVHSAGIMIEKSVIEADDDDFDRLFGVNVKAPLRLTRAAWPALAETKGKVVILASLSGKRVKSPRSSLYAMSKFSAVALSHAIRQCGSEAGIRSTAICPGFVATDMAGSMQGVDLDAVTKPADVARIVRLVLELPASASIAEIPVNWRVEDSY
ncbi:SDR family NAD(P)-dependent oxidoreductase [Consotaella aegiceratis]|uniref:SDR family NAD(P)-dependent oxidoreductase n=1 Tax=Consotaella aegiceratis TaxID=3097961 RepID=UPI002F3EB19C